MRFFDVNTQPVSGLRGQRREVSENSPTPKAPWQRMTEDEFNTWLAAQPPIESPPPTPEPPPLEARIATLEAKEAQLRTEQAALKGEVETLKTAATKG